MARSMLRDFIASNESGDVKDKPKDNKGEGAASDEPTSQEGEGTEVKDKAVGGDAEHVETVKDAADTYTEKKIAQNDVEAAEKIQSSVEEFKSALEASVDNGGLSGDALTLSKIAVESLAREMGVKSESVLGFEAFDKEDADPVEATKATLESLEETLEVVRGSVERAREALNAKEQ